MRHEHDNIVHLHLRRFHIRRIVLLRKFFDVALNAVDVCLQGFLTRHVVLCIQIVKEGRERHLGVNDDFTALVEVQNHVGAHHAAFF